MFKNCSEGERMDMNQTKVKKVAIAGYNIVNIMSDHDAKDKWIITGPVHKSSREMREIGSLDEANRDGGLVGGQ